MLVLRLVLLVNRFDYANAGWTRDEGHLGGMLYLSSSFR